MLHLLKKYADTHFENQPEPGFDSISIRWVMLFDKSGGFLETVEIGDVENKRNKGQIFGKCPNLGHPDMKSGGITKSQFLRESAEVIGLYGTKADTVKLQQKHEYFIKLLYDSRMAMPILEKVAQSLEDNEILGRIKKSFELNRIRPTEKVTIRVDNEYPIESEKIQTLQKKNPRCTLIVAKQNKDNEGMPKYISDISEHLAFL